jgi:hypothetical protein
LVAATDRTALEEYAVVSTDYTERKPLLAGDQLWLPVALRV